TNSQILSNIAGSSPSSSGVGGGGIVSSGTISGTTIDSNRALSDDGGIIAAGSDTVPRTTLNIVNTTISNNQAIAGSYGGIEDRGGNLVISGSIIRGNTSTLDGAGLYLRYGASVTNSMIASNVSSAGKGGGIVNDSSGGIITIQSSTL